MKTIFYTIVAVVMIIAISTLSSCEKETSQGDNWKTSIRSYVKAEQDATSLENSAHRPRISATLAADFLGAFAIGEVGAIFGPWGAFGGALIGGVAGSVSIWRTMGPNIDTSPSNYPENPYDAAGKLHNVLCERIVNDPDTYFTDDGHMTPAYQSMVIDEILKMEPSAKVEDLESLDYNIAIDNTKRYLENGDLSFISDSDLRFIAKEFLTGINSCTSEEEAMNFIEGFQKIIQTSSLPVSKKIVTLNAISVASHSNHLWK